MGRANGEYTAAVARASQSHSLNTSSSSSSSSCAVVDVTDVDASCFVTEALHAQIDGVLRNMLSEDEFAAEVEGPG